MEARVVSRHVRIAPRKVRLVADLVRGKRVGEAIGMLQHVSKKAAPVLVKALKSAVANAENTQRVDVDQLYVKHISVDPGPTAKRFLPRAHGRATKLRKRTAHIVVVVDEQTRK
jgi:large subunit ribosomal protein L22